MSRRRARRNGGHEGFTLVELLVAMTIVLLMAGVIVHAATGARAAFERLPAVIDMQQRGRAAVDVLSQALRPAGQVIAQLPEDDGTYSQLTVVAPIASPAQGVLAVDQSTPAGSMTLAASPCPNVKDVCGFVNGATAMVNDNSGHFDVFIVASANAALRRLSPDHALSRAYPAGAMLIEVEQNTFGLDEQEDGTYALTRVTAAGAVQPVVDGIRSLSFGVNGHRIDINLIVHAPTPVLQRAIADHHVTASVSVRNVP
jgi:prepilin-type N-terminal cleavage/methylation domain-containing protein